MVITEKALSKINTIENRLKLGLALKVTEQAIIRYISNNVEDGPLTKATATILIKELTGLTDSEILQAEAKATA